MQAVIDVTGFHDPPVSPVDDKESKYTLPIVDEAVVERIVRKLSEIGVTTIQLYGCSERVKEIFYSGAEIDLDKWSDVDIVFTSSTSRSSIGRPLDSNHGFLYLKGNTMYHWESVAQIASERAAVGYIDMPSESAHGQVSIKDDTAIDIHPGSHPLSGPEGAYVYRFPKEAHEWDYDINPMIIEMCHTQSPVAVPVSSWNPIECPSDLLDVNMCVVEEEHDGSYIADDVTIAPGSVICGNVVILEGSSVMENATVESSMLLPNAYVGPNSYVGYSILSKSTRVGQGVTTVTNEGSGSNVMLSFTDGSVSNTGEILFGSVSGPNSNIRAGTTLLEGSVIDTGTVIPPGTTY